MQIKLEISHIGKLRTVPGKNKRSYHELDVVYWENGDKKELKTRTLRDFVNPAVFKTAQSLNEGDFAVADLIKDDNGYWNWKSLEKMDSEQAQAENQAGQESSQSATRTGETKPTGRVMGSNYETPQERAWRQVLIVRQSSLAQAITYHKEFLANSGNTIEEVLDTASKFEEWVNRKEEVADVAQ